MTYEQERWALIAVIVAVIGGIYLLQDRFGVWSGLVIGAFLVLLVGGWSKRWYRGADLKMYRTW